jgi:quinol monooxygenase YgiN
VASILVHIHIRPGFERAFEAAIATLWTQTHALETGVQRYEYWRSDTPNTWYALLSYEHEVDFLHHQISDHHEDGSKVFGPMFESVRLEWIDPVPGANHIASSAAQDLPADASAELRAAKRRYGQKLAAWWGLLAD